jgi:hypothetical protein
MKRLFPIVLSTVAICVAAAATPAAAQVAGNPGDQHTPTVYTEQYDRTVAPGAAGPTVGFVPVPIFAVQGPAQCGVTQDFNGRYTSVCGL